MQQAQCLWRSLRMGLTGVLLVGLARTVLAEPATYVVDPSHTFPRFAYQHLGFSQQEHKFNRSTGQITFDPVARTGHAEIVIDAKSVDTGDTKFDAHIQDGEFFATAEHPEIRFVSEGLIYENDRPVRLDGQLTIKGVTRPVSLTLTHFHHGLHPMRKKMAIGANAHTEIRRSEFGLGKYVPLVSDAVTIRLSLEAVQQ